MRIFCDFFSYSLFFSLYVLRCSLCWENFMLPIYVKRMNNFMSCDAININYDQIVVFNLIFQIID